MSHNEPLQHGTHRGHFVTVSIEPEVRGCHAPHRSNHLSPMTGVLCMRRSVVLSPVLALAIAAGTACTAVTQPSDQPGFGFAVIGDIPYGQPQIDQFPKVIDQINADP